MACEKITLVQMESSATVPVRLDGASVSDACNDIQPNGSTAWPRNALLGARGVAIRKAWEHIHPRTPETERTPSIWSYRSRRSSRTPERFRSGNGEWPPQPGCQSFRDHAAYATFCHAPSEHAPGYVSESMRLTASSILVQACIDYSCLSTK